MATSVSGRLEAGIYRGPCPLRQGGTLFKGDTFKGDRMPPVEAFSLLQSPSTPPAVKINAI